MDMKKKDITIEATWPMVAVIVSSTILWKITKKVLRKV